MIVSNLTQFLDQTARYTKVALLSDAKVFSHHGARLQNWIRATSATCAAIEIPSSEEGKTLPQAERCWHGLFEQGFDRQSLVVGMGGGATLDLAGFVASTFMRGVDLAFVPTTLLAMVDASIGGKTALNFGYTKNGIGTFYPAQWITLWPETLTTLPERIFRCGLAEVIKAALIADREFFCWLEQHMGALVQKDAEPLTTAITRAISIKHSIVEKDPKDLGLRKQLNFGHTFGHALESATGFQLQHGEAVAIGMSCAMRLSAQLGVLSDDTLPQRLDALLTTAGLPIHYSGLCPDTFLGFMRRDKKGENGTLVHILLEDVGRPCLRAVPESAIVGVLEAKNMTNNYKT